MPLNPYQQGGGQYGRLGPRGGVYSPRPQQGLLPAPRSAATRVVDFIDGFKEKQKQKKAEAKAEFEEAMKMLEAGIPIDQNKTARLARKAGLDFDYDGPTRKEVQAQNQQRMQQAQQAQQSQRGMMMPPAGPGARGLPSMTPRPNLAGMQQGMQQPLPAPRPQPGLGSRMAGGAMSGMGMMPAPRGQIPQNAGIMQHMQQVAAKATSRQEFEKIKFQFQQTLQSHMKKYIESSGENKKSRKILRDFGILETPEMVKKINGLAEMMPKVDKAALAAATFREMAGLNRRDEQYFAARNKIAESYLPFFKGGSGEPDHDAARAFANAKMGGTMTDYIQGGGKLPSRPFELIESEAKAVTEIQKQFIGMHRDTAGTIFAIRHHGPTDMAQRSRAEAAVTASFQRFSDVASMNQQRQAEISRENLNIRREDSALDKELELITSTVLTLSGGDPDEALKLLPNLTLDKAKLKSMAGVSLTPEQGVRLKARHREVRELLLKSKERWNLLEQLLKDRLVDDDAPKPVDTKADAAVGTFRSQLP